MACAICQIRRPRRYCPGVEGEICSLCCGTEREVTVSCPFTCEFLQESRKHEDSTPLDLPELPNADIRVSEKSLEEHQELLAFASHYLVESALNFPGIVDFDVRQALDALIRTWRTLQSGIYYESLPQERPALHVYRSMQEGIEELLRASRPGDAILTIGAGNVSRAPGELAILLGARVFLHHAN